MRPLRNIDHDRPRVGSTKYADGSLMHVITLYKESYFWKDLADKTKQDYNYYVRLIQEWSIQNDNPLMKNITPKDIMGWLSYFEATPVRQKRAKAVISQLFNVAIQFDYTDKNPVKSLRLRRRQTERRKLVLWEDRHVQKIVETCDKAGRFSMGHAIMIAYNTAQRQGDILKLRQPDHYSQGFFYFQQSKTGSLVDIPVTQSLKDRLSMIPTDQELLVFNEKTGKPWTNDNFIKVFRDMANKSGLPDHWFMELRHSCVYQLNRAGCTPNQIASITGHSLKTILEMLQNHYLEIRDATVASEAINKLENMRGKSA